MSFGPTYRQHERVPGAPDKVLRFLGAGGMGAVYEVEDTTIGKRYVLKTVHLDFVESAGSENAERMLQQEARMLAQVSHPNIVDVITAGKTADRHGLPFLVMEKLDGVTLRAMLDKLVLPRRSVGQIADELLDALMHLHHPADSRAPMLHRDIKPENIFLAKERDRRYTTKLLDLGIAVLLDGPSHGVHGTPAYMAPEQFRGEHLDERTDLYQAGCVIFEMLAGKHPFAHAQTLSEVSSAHLFQPAPRLSSLMDIEPGIDAVIAAALSKERKLRPVHARAFADGLMGLREQLMATNVGEHLRRAFEDEQANGYVAYATGCATIQTLGSPDGRISSLMGVAMPAPPRLDAPASEPVKSSAERGEPQVAPRHVGPVPSGERAHASPPEISAVGGPTPSVQTGSTRNPPGAPRMFTYVTIGLAVASIAGAIAVIAPMVRKEPSTAARAASVATSTPSPMTTAPPPELTNAAPAPLVTAAAPGSMTTTPASAAVPETKPPPAPAPSPRSTRNVAPAKTAALAPSAAEPTSTTPHRPDFLPLSLSPAEPSPAPASSRTNR